MHDPGDTMKPKTQWQESDRWTTVGDLMRVIGSVSSHTIIMFRLGDNYYALRNPMEVEVGMITESMEVFIPWEKLGDNGIANTLLLRLEGDE